MLEHASPKVLLGPSLLRLLSKMHRASMKPCFTGQTQDMRLFVPFIITFIADWIIMSSLKTCKNHHARSYVRNNSQNQSILSLPFAIIMLLPSRVIDAIWKGMACKACPIALEQWNLTFLLHVTQFDFRNHLLQKMKAHWKCNSQSMKADPAAEF